MRAQLVAAVALLWAAGCAPAPQQFGGPTMGTTYSVTVTQLPRGVTREALQAVIDDVLDEVNRHLSTYDPGSEISKFNALRSTEAVQVSPQLHAVVALAEAVRADTGGAFDITVGSEVRAWGFGGRHGLELPAEGRFLRKTAAGVELDVNGIAPGHAVDLIAGRFDALGVPGYLVELGGEVRARGRSPAGRIWRVAVELPLRGARAPYTLVELDGMSASTSGDYRDFRVVDGHRVSHTIDPRTGAPVTHDLASVCVLHSSAARADAYATALMVLGPVDGLELARRLGIAALFIERDTTGGGFRDTSTPEFERLRRPLD